MFKEKRRVFRRGVEGMSNAEGESRREVGRALRDAVKSDLGGFANSITDELTQMTSAVIEESLKEKDAKIRARQEKLEENQALLDLKVSINLDLQKSYSPEQEESNFNENMDTIYSILNSLAAKMAVRNPQMKDINDNIQEQIVLLDDLVTAVSEGTITKDEYQKVFKEKLVTGKGFSKFYTYYENIFVSESTKKDIEDLVLCKQYLDTLLMFLEVLAEKVDAV